VAAAKRQCYHGPVPSTSRDLGLLRLHDARLGDRSEAELIAAVLAGSEPPAVIAAQAQALARLPFWERRSLGAAGLVRHHGFARESAIRLAALWELAERWYPDDRPVVTGPSDVLPLLHLLRVSPRERVELILLDARHRPITIETVALGSVNAARLAPRDVLGPALRRDAVAFVLAHNHPSGEVTPSRADRLVTQTLRDAARLVGLELLDHIIVTARTHYSFRDVEAWDDSARAA